MAYENDIIMRQVRDMTRMLAKILFGKNTATYEYKEEDRHTATDSSMPCHKVRRLLSNC